MHFSTCTKAACKPKIVFSDAKSNDDVDEHNNKYVACGPKTPFAHKKTTMSARFLLYLFHRSDRRTKCRHSWNERIILCKIKWTLLYKQYYIIIILRIIELHIYTKRENIIVTESARLTSDPRLALFSRTREEQLKIVFTIHLIHIAPAIFRWKIKGGDFYIQFTVSTISLSVRREHSDKRKL